MGLVRFILTRSKMYWWILAGSAFFVFCLTFGFAFYYSTTPSFCQSCHIMEPYYKAWVTSKHNKVSCVQCHYPPATDKKEYLWLKFQALSQVVKYVTRTYNSKPYAEVPDESCLRSGCHATRLLEGKIEYKRGIMFDHRSHLLDLKRGKKLRCTSCHSQVMVGTHMEVTDNTCYVCHFKGRQDPRGAASPIAGCPSCHAPPTSDFKLGNITYNHKDFVARGVPCINCHLEAIQGEGEAPKERCLACHNRPDVVQKYEDVTFLHSTHITDHGIECSQCHLEIKHRATTSKPIGLSCEVCHSEMHNVQKQIYMGVGARGVEESMPSPMYLAQVDCIGCHQQKKKEHETATSNHGTTYRASELGCINCHGKEYDGLLPGWKRTLTATLTALRPKLEAAEKQVMGHPEAAKLVRDARFNYDFVKEAHGVHNIYYASRVLETANRYLDSAFTQIKMDSPVDLSSDPLISGNYCMTLCHTPLKVNYRFPEVTHLNGKTVPHRKHWIVFKVGCKSCHRVGQHKEISLSVTPKDCLGCHHKGKPEDCGTCHADQQALYKGTFEVHVDVAKKLPNSMDGTVDCAGCHDDISSPIDEAHISALCVDCHEESYKTMIRTWRDEQSAEDLKARALLKKIKGKAARGELADMESDLDRLLKTRSVHNPDLVKSIYEAIQKKLTLLSTPSKE